MSKIFLREKLGVKSDPLSTLGQKERKRGERERKRERVERERKKERTNKRERER